MGTLQLAGLEEGANTYKIQDRKKIGLQGVKFSILSDCHNMFEQEMGEDFHTAYKDGQWMEGLKRQHRRAMDPEVNPLDGALLPLSPALAYIQQKILPRILRNPFARPFLRPVDAVKEGIFPDYYQVVTRPMCVGTVERRLAAGWYWDANHCLRDIQQVWTNAKMYNPASHPIHEWAATLEMLVSTWLRRLPSEVGKDLRLAVEERNLRACTNILTEISRSQTVFLAKQLGLPELERRLASGEFESGEAYREGTLDCNLVS